MLVLRFFILSVTFEMRHHIGTKERSPIELTAIFLNDFYWKTAPNWFHRYRSSGWEAAGVQTFPMGFTIVNKILLQPIFRKLHPIAKMAPKQANPFRVCSDEVRHPE